MQPKKAEKQSKVGKKKMKSKKDEDEEDFD